MIIKLSSIFTYQRLVKFFAVLWVLCIIIVVLTVFFGTNGFEGVVQHTAFGNSSAFLILLVGSISIGVLAFGLLILTIIVKIILEKKVLVFKKSFIGVLVFGFKLLFLLSVFPLFLLYRVSNAGELISRIRKQGFKISFLKPKGIKPFVARLVAIVAISLTFLPIWISGYVVTGTLVASQLGYVNEEIAVSGTGSMYPTFPKGQSKTLQEQAKEIVDTSGMFPYPNGLVVLGKRIFGHQVGRGDIVVIENEKIKESTKELVGEATGWVKRVIAVGGDTLEIKDGIVYLNGKSLEEPYITKARSTFGESFLKECNKVTIPDDYIFVMGDNRKGSGDSREIGFIEIGAVNHVLPFNKQKGVLDEHWRDTSKDFDEASKIILDKVKYVELLNEKRKEAGVKPLKYQLKLEQSAFKRGEVVLKYDDYSYEATRSGYTQLKAMNEVGYSNIVWNEGIVQGHYEADELIEYLFEFPDWKKNLLQNKDLQEIGIAEVEIADGCSGNVIVAHFAGYIPPNYSKEDIESWRQTIDNLNSVIPSWEALRGKGWVDENELSRLLSLLYSERTIASNILSKMESNKWLTKEEENSINEFNQLSQESAALGNKLNER